jgi:prepilin-type N-terminal cleavage/methylation domain-containing protein
MCVRGGDLLTDARAASLPGSRASRSERGFTMIEIMVALLLTAIAVMGILSVYLAQTRASSFSRHASEAVILAQDKLEQLRTQLAATTSGGDVNINERGVATGVFTRRWTQTLGASYADIVVTITWTENGVARQFVLRGRRNA